jgi:hypothetical protein
MKFRLSLLLMTLVLAAASSSTAHALTCSDTTISGRYAFTIHGQIFLPNGGVLLIDGLAETTFDGRGNLTQLDAVATNGFVAPGWRHSTGNYAVNPDCTGSFTVTNGDLAPIYAQIVIAQSGNKIHAIVIDPGIATTSDAERIVAPQD